MESVSSIAGSVLVIVVLYNRALLDSETLCTLNHSCAKINVRLDVVIYDNSFTIHEISNATHAFPYLAITYIHDPTNPGVAGAYNYGLKMALYLKRDRVWIFDQDSTLNEEFVELTFRAVINHPELDLYLPYVRSGSTIVSPTRTFWGRSIGQRGLQVGINPSKEFFAINSGMLICTSYLSLIGGYDDRFKLYLTDNWFCDRFVCSQRSFSLTGATMLHDLSRDSTKDIDHLLHIYRINLHGYKEIYKNRPLHFIVLISFAVGGAVKRAIKYRDKRFIEAWLNLLKAQ